MGDDSGDEESSYWYNPHDDSSLDIPSDFDTEIDDSLFESEDETIYTWDDEQKQGMLQNEESPMDSQSNAQNEENVEIPNQPVALHHNQNVENIPYGYAACNRGRIKSRHPRNVKFFIRKELRRSKSRGPEERRPNQAKKSERKERYCCSKSDLYYVALRLQTSTGTITQFRNEHEHIRHGPLRHIKKVSPEALRLWRNKFSAGSEDFAELETFLQENKHKDVKHVKAFHAEQFEHFGVAPVMERFFMKVRKKKAKSNEDHTYRWLTELAEKTISDGPLYDMLSNRMDETERNAIEEFRRNGFSSSWIKKIAVRMFYQIIRNIFLKHII